MKWVKEQLKQRVEYCHVVHSVVCCWSDHLIVIFNLNSNFIHQALNIVKFWNAKYWCCITCTLSYVRWSLDNPWLFSEVNQRRELCVVQVADFFVISPFIPLSTLTWTLPSEGAPLLWGWGNWKENILYLYEEPRKYDSVICWKA